MASGEKASLVEPAAVRLWPCARPLECGMLPQQQYREKGNRLSCQVCVCVGERER